MSRKGYSATTLFLVLQKLRVIGGQHEVSLVDGVILDQIEAVA
jgi:hypothetical protein